MDKQLKRQMIHILESGMAGNIMDYADNWEFKSRAFKNSWEYERVHKLLQDAGYIGPEKMHASTTIAGLDYLASLQKSLEHPVKVWLKGNWFPLAVAIITATVAISGVVVQVALRN